MEAKRSHETYLIVIALVLAAFIIGYNALLAPKVNGIGVVYRNDDSSQAVSWPAAVSSEETSSEDDPGSAVSEVSSSGESPASEINSSTRTDPVSSPSSTQSPSSTTPAAPGLININTATAAQLETLPGIGSVKAQAIIRYRETYGPFHSVKELTLVKGIGEKTLEKLLPYICV